MALFVIHGIAGVVLDGDSGKGIGRHRVEHVNIGVAWGENGALCNVVGVGGSAAQVGYIRRINSTAGSVGGRQTKAIWSGTRMWSVWSANATVGSRASPMRRRYSANSRAAGLRLTRMFSVSGKTETERQISEFLRQAFSTSAWVPRGMTGRICRKSPPKTTTLPPNGTSTKNLAKATVYGFEHVSMRHCGFVPNQQCCISNR